MSFINSKLKPRVKPRLGGKASDATSPVELENKPKSQESIRGEDNEASGDNETPVMSSAASDKINPDGLPYHNEGITSHVVSIQEGENATSALERSENTKLKHIISNPDDHRYSTSVPTNLAPLKNNDFVGTPVRSNESTCHEKEKARRSTGEIESEPPSNNISTFESSSAIANRSSVDDKSSVTTPGSDSTKTLIPPVSIPEIGTVSEQIEPSKVNDDEPDGLSIDNSSHVDIPIIDTSIRMIQPSRTVNPLSTVDTNNDIPTSAHQEKEKPISSTNLESSAKSVAGGASGSSSSKIESNEKDVEDEKTLNAFSAVEYLKRHDHALGDTILRKLIAGEKNTLTGLPKPSTCSSCNPLTLKKCLTTLWSFSKPELVEILKKAAKREKTSSTHANLSGRPPFKPSLGKQRAPTVASSTYGKMCYNVKEGLAKKYGSATPELSKMKMLDFIFYNPSSNPMTKVSDKKETPTSQKQPVSSEPSTSKSGLPQEEIVLISSSDSEPDEPTEEISESNDSETDTDNAFPTDERNNSSVPVPQVKIGDEGQIILAPESLVLKKKDSDILNDPVVHDSGFPNLARKRNNPDRTTWNFEETTQFYKALHGMGTDFTSMVTLFPDRTRKNLKIKFKREEKRNPLLIDKVIAALGRRVQWSDVEKELATDKALKKIAAEGSRKNHCRILSTLGPELLKSLTGRFSKGNEVTGSTPCKPASSMMKNEKPQKKNINTAEESENKPQASADVANAETVGRETAEAFKKPRTVPPVRRKRKLDTTTRNISRKVRKTTTEPPSPIRIINLVDDDDNLSDDSGEGSSEEASGSHTETCSLADDDCFVIETNFENEDYNCRRSVSFSINNLERLDVNETIEHKDTDIEAVRSVSEHDIVIDPHSNVVEPLDESIAEPVDDYPNLGEDSSNQIVEVLNINQDTEVGRLETEDDIIFEPIAEPVSDDLAEPVDDNPILGEDSSNQIVEVLNININQLPEYLERTGAIVIGQAENNVTEHKEGDIV